MQAHALDDLLTDAHRTLSSAERDRCDAMAAEDAADLRRAAYALRRRAAAARLGVAAETVVFAGFREPLLDGTSHISLSHTAGAVAIALADRPVGVDIEPIGRTNDTLRLAARYFAPEETHALAALERGARPEAFARLWTAKEARMKATGMSLSAALSTYIDEVGVTIFQPASDFVCAIALGA